LTEVESKEIVGIWSRGVGKLVIAVGFSAVDPEGLLDDGVRLAPSRRSVNMGVFLGGQTVAYRGAVGSSAEVSHRYEDKKRREISEVWIEGNMSWS